MQKEKFYSLLEKNEFSDYEIYLKTKELFSCQSKFEDLCNGDELQFQIVHQSEELQMRLINYTLIDIIESMKKLQTNKVIILFKRVHQSQLNMLQILGRVIN